MKTKILNSLWLLSEKLFLLIVELLVITAIARHLGVSEFGKLSLVFTFVLIVNPFTVCGLSSLLSRYCLDPKENSISTILSTASFLKFSSSLLSSVTLLFILYCLSTDLEIISYVAILLVSEVFKSFNVASNWFESNLLSKWTATARVLAVSLSSIIKLIGVYLDLDWKFFVIAQSFEFLVQVIFLLIFFYMKSKDRISLRNVDTNLLKEMLFKAFPLLLASVGATVYLKADAVMVSYMIDVKAVGIYTAATRLVEVMFVLPVIYLIAIFPTLMMYKDTLEKFDRLVNKHMSILLYSGLILSISVLLLSDFLIDILYGNEYAQSKDVLIIYAFSLPLFFMRTLISKWLIIKELYRISLVNQLSGAVSNVFLNIYLIPIYGVKGAAYATIFSLIFSSLLPMLIFKESRTLSIAMMASINVKRMFR